MVYPLFLLAMVSAVVAAMLAFFVPKFKPMFDEMSARGTLPWATTALISMCDGIREYGLYGIAAVAGGSFALVQWLKTEEGRWKFDTVRLKSPGVGPIVRSLAISRFCRILGTLLRNGVPILQSLRIAKDATGNRVLSQAIGVAGGRAFRQASRWPGR